jgi:predicted amidohydrolase YtcJ
MTQRDVTIRPITVEGKASVPAPRVLAPVSTSWDPADGLTNFGPYRMPRRYKVRIDEQSRPVVVELEVVIEDGRAVCERISAVRRRGGPPVSGNLRFPLSRFLQNTAAIVARRKARGQKGGWAPLSPGDLEDFYQQYRIQKMSGQRRTIDDARLRQVAALYRMAVANHEPPGKRIAHEMFVSEEHARRLVGQARKRSFLGPARRGRAGEET